MSQSDEKSKEYIDKSNLVNTPSDSLFSRDYMRKGQYDFYQDCKSAFKNSKILFADAPTGIGKTSASLASALESAILNGRKVLFATNRNSQHLQALIEVTEFIKKRQASLNVLRPDMPTIRVVDKISKEKMCPRLIGKNERPQFLLCEISHCPLQVPKQDFAQILLSNPITATKATALGAKDNAFCAHKTAILASNDADLIICDYSYLFNSQIREFMQLKMGVRLSDCHVILDEAHNLPKRICDINECKINEDTIKRSIRGLSAIRKLATDSQNSHIFSQASIVARHLRMEISFSLTSLVYEFEPSKESAISPSMLKFFAQKVSLISQPELKDRAQLFDLIDELCYFFSESLMKNKTEDVDYDGVEALRNFSWFVRIVSDFAWGNKRWGVFLKRDTHESGAYILRAILLDPSEASAQVFSSMHSAVLMSGTLAGKNYIRELLGIHTNRCMGLENKSYISPFDTKKQPIVICDEVSSRFNDRSKIDKISKMLKLIEKSASAIYPHSFAVFYPSYEFMEQICAELKLDGFYMHKEGRGLSAQSVSKLKKLINEHSKSKYPIAFQAVIGAKYNEGIDFSENPFKMIIVAGFPYPKNTASHKAFESYLNLKYSSKTKANEYSSLYPATISAMQTIGRGIRQPSDWCYCILADDRFIQYDKYFSDSIKSRIRKLSINDLISDIEKFKEDIKN